MIAAALLAAVESTAAAQAPRTGVLITGGSGYLGHALVEKLLADGCPRICIYSRSESRQAQMRAYFKDDERLRWFIGDVRDVRRLERAMASVYSVIHAAALKRIEVGVYNPDEMVKTNVDGTMNVIDAARRTGIGKVLLVSSDKAYAPVSPYGQTKAIAESLVRMAQDPQFGPRFAVVRYGNVAGSTGSVIPTWRERIRGGLPVMMTDPQCTRFWMTREEAAKLVIDTMVGMNGGELAVPELPAFSLEDLWLAMGKPDVQVSGLPDHEKLHESMEPGKSSDQADRLTVEELRHRLEALA